MSISMMEEVDSSMLHQTFLASADNYQHKYFDLQKTTQELLQKSLQADVQSSIIRNTVGVYMLNLV